MSQISPIVASSIIMRHAVCPEILWHVKSVAGCMPARPADKLIRRLQRVPIS